MNNNFEFVKAVPVWEKGTSKMLNRSLDFIVNLKKAPGSKLFVAGSTSFSVYVNGEFIAFGPARAAHGFYKVDEINLDSYLKDGGNILNIRVNGYNLNSFCYLDQPSFLCAEVSVNGEVIASTGENFKAVGFDSKIIKAPRYSYQRVFCEAYNLNGHTFDACLSGAGTAVELERVACPVFLKRDVPYGEYKRLYAAKVLKCGTAEQTEELIEYNTRENKGVDGEYKGYYEAELQVKPWQEYSSLSFKADGEAVENARKITLGDGRFADVDMLKNYTGLFDFTVEFKGNGKLIIAFDEILENGDINCYRETLNVMVINGERGKYRFTSAEPYVMRYARLTAIGAELEISDFGMREVAYPEKEIKLSLSCEDEAIAKIYDAALRSFRSNVFDIFMDCPSRERAGWLCDSFFIGRTEMALTGKTTVERAFLNNFLLPKHFDGLPDGMLPMCYPADVMRGSFIPNWAMWFGLEVYDYYTRTGDELLVENAKSRLYGLLEYFKGFENEYGLLERLEGWIFVEWSKANELVQEVSFPTNMVYAALKSAVGTLYNDTALILEGSCLRETIREMSLTDSGYFCDNAVRRGGKLCLTGERTEVCQYYAFFFKIADTKEFGTLWNTLVNNFGFNKSVTDANGPIYPANAFIGNYLRMELLLLDGKKDKLYSDIKDYFTYMAELTGTLWEHKNAGASCNHGFASYVIYWLKQLGAVTE